MQIQQSYRVKNRVRDIFLPLLLKRDFQVSPTFTAKMQVEFMGNKKEYKFRMFERRFYDYDILAISSHGDLPSNMLGFPASQFPKTVGPVRGVEDQYKIKKNY